MSAYWPFWLGAPALALVTVGACLVGRRPLGVSGIVARFVDLRRELQSERSRATLAAADDAAIEAALLAATLEAFGPMPAPAGIAPGAATAISGGCSTGHGLSGCSRLQPAGLAATATFLGAAVAVSFLLAGRLG